MDVTELNVCMERLRAGDREAFSALYDAMSRPVYTVARRIVQSREIAEDITQEVFVRLYVSPPPPSIENPRAWIFRMARNLAIDAWRKKQSTDIDDVQLAEADVADAVALRLDTEAAIGHLPAMERQILSLHLDGDMPFREIAPIVGLSLPAVYRRYRKAIKTLQNLL